MKIVLYSNSCPCCQAQKGLLDKAGVEYTIESDIDKMMTLGLRHLPMLTIDERMLNYQAALAWLKERTKPHEN